ncbi:SusC/RagA family TonB-linked outer membrane protein [uncultured Fibrella sp.]|uniref:SusC/RagA family TonB-linked outer membrane protein n=1 Tax=uncultured Fibrella sp. TaxID=1284596 RepID=UPI0035CB426F
MLQFLAVCAVAQTKITGRITGDADEELPGVSVVVKGTSTGTVTGSDGRYSLTVPNNNVTLVFSFIGYVAQEVPLAGRSSSSVDVKLLTDNKSLDEIVVVGYGEQRKTSSTAAVSTLKAADVAMKPVVNLTNSLGGRVAGVISRQGSGEPGQDGANINIRGISTTGNSQPLLIVDGIYRDFSRLDPSSIETFTVLKDAAAVAPYGLAGANGVVLVTTKRGKAGTPTLSYNGWVGIQNPTRVTPQVNSYEFALMQNEAAVNDGRPAAYTADQVEGYRKTVTGEAGADPDRYPNSSPLTDLIDPNTVLTYHNLELSGGSDKIRYYMGMAYTNQQGMYRSVYTKKYNLIAKIDADATPTTKVSLNINGFIEDNVYPGRSAGDLFYQAFRTPPVSPVYYSNGLWGQYIGRSLVGQAFYSGETLNERNQLYTTFTIEQQLPFIKGLSLKGVVSYDPDTRTGKAYSTPVPVYTVDLSKQPYNYVLGVQGASKPSLSQGYSQNKAFTYQGLINYANSFGKHNVTALGVFEYRNQKYNQFGASRLNFNTTIPELSVGSSTPLDISNYGSSSEQQQIGYVYRIGYNFDEKYLFEVAGRYDGHYVFAPGQRYGFFPSFSAGWRISEESFMKNNVTWVDALKIRGSYGESGALPYFPGNPPQLAAFQYLSSYSLYGGSAVFGDPTQGVSERAQANPNITWERAKKFNIGLEGSLYKGKLTFEVDYFTERRSNMLVVPFVSVPAEYGVGLSQVNAGVMQNQGIDLTMGTNHRIGRDLRISMNVNFLYSKNKLIETFETNATRLNPNRAQTGRPLNTPFGYHALGYFTADDFNADGSLKAGIPTQPWGAVRPGDLRYADLAGAPGADGIPTAPDGKIDANDQTVTGFSNTPQIVYGLIPKISYKGFDLDLLFSGAARSGLGLFGSIVYPFDASASATKLEFTDHWTPTNPNALYPRLTGAPTTNNTQGSDWWVRNNSYIRLKQIELGYRLPASLISRAKLTSARFYISGQNMFTITPNMKEIIDPEASTGNAQYYFQQRVITFGTNLTF